MGHEDLGSGAIADLEVDTDAASKESTDSDNPTRHQADHTPGLCQYAVVMLRGRHGEPLQAISRASERKEKGNRATSRRKEGASAEPRLLLFGCGDGARQGSFSASRSASSLGATRGMPSRSMSSNATSNPGASGSHAATIGQASRPQASRGHCTPESHDLERFCLGRDGGVEPR